MVGVQCLAVGLELSNDYSTVPGRASRYSFDLSWLLNGLCALSSSGEGGGESFEKGGSLFCGVLKVKRCC